MDECGYGKTLCVCGGGGGGGGGGGLVGYATQLSA